MAIPYDPRFNKNPKISKTFSCGFCSKPFPDLGQMLSHEDACSGEVVEESEVSDVLPIKDDKPKLNPPNAPFKPNLPYGYGKR